MKTNLILFAAMVALASLMSPFAALAEVSVDNVAAKQRYPWNGLVDIDCTVSGIEGTGGEWKFAVAAVDAGSGDARSVSQFRVVRNGTTNSTDLTVSTNGNYRLVWDAGADLGEGVFSNVVVRVTLKAVPKKGQLWEGGPIWAEKNVGADEPWDYGLYFWWGDTVGYRRVGSAWVASDGSSSNFSFSEGNTPTYGKSPDTLRSQGWTVTKDGTDVLAPAHDAAHVHWGGNWRMPTKDELSALNNNCDWTWTATNGVNGYVVSGRGDYASSRIFLPAAGYGYWTSLYYAGSYGYYWSSVPYSGNSNYAYGLDFDSGYHSTYNYNRYRGLSVRPVQGFAE